MQLMSRCSPSQSDASCEAAVETTAIPGTLLSCPRGSFVHAIPSRNRSRPRHFSRLHSLHARLVTKSRAECRLSVKSQRLQRSRKNCSRDCISIHTHQRLEILALRDIPREFGSEWHDRCNTKCIQTKLQLQGS